MKIRLTLLSAALAVSVTTALIAEAPPARHVIVVVFDGMRPDFVSSVITPNLWQLAQDGVFFANHHPVYCSSTEVNGTAIATGAYPSHSFVIANSEYRPGIDPQKAIGTSQLPTVRKGDELSGGRYLGVATLAEYLHTQGVATAISGSKAIAILHDRSGRSPLVFAGKALAKATEDEVVAAIGAFPASGVDATTGRQDRLLRDDWTTRALTDVLWKNGVPAYSLLWLAEPDESEHSFGPGSSQAIIARKNSDANLGRVLATLEKRGLRASTDVLVVADHGMSTISRKIDVAGELSKAGFDATRAVPGGLKSGQVLVVTNSGTVLLYVGAHDTVVTHRLAAWLPTQDWVGTILSREPAEGTFALAEAHIDSPGAPDFAVALHWSDSRSATGASGQLTADDSGRGIGQGTHGSLSAYDLHNTLIAAGPDFKRGVRDPLPSANFDVTPTVLHLLGFREEAAKRDGRVLSEALTIAAPPLQKLEFKRLQAQCDTPVGKWTQYLQVSEVNGVRYLDEGNGTLLPKEQFAQAGATATLSR